MRILPIVAQIDIGGSIPVPQSAGIYMLTDAPLVEGALREVLEFVGIRVLPEPDPQGLSVIVVTGDPSPDRVKALPDPLAEALRSVPTPQAPESYSVRVGDLGAAPWVILAGGDERGTFYAVQTLRQVLDAVAGEESIASLPQLQIDDAPAFGMRGIIEGFYGPPWSHPTRLELLDFMGRYKMNTFVYAPKDDPYHRERWREPYPPAEKARLAELVDRAQKNRVDFVFAISPGLSIEYSSDEEFERLVEKTEAMWELGVRHFALLLDDISPELIHPSDRARFGSDLGAAHAYLVNRYNRFLKAKGAAPLIMVPLDYYQPGPTPYRTSLAQLMDPDVLVYWTGIGVVVPTITSEDAQRISAVYGNELLVWDNYPVNDFRRTRLFLGPLQGRDPDLWEQVAGLTADPMNEGEASKIPLITVASYLWNPTSYDAHVVWDLALRREGGAAYQALRRLAEVSTESALHPDATSTLERLLVTAGPTIEALISPAASAGAVGDVDVLLPIREEFEAWQRVPAELIQGLANRRLYEEIGPYAEKMRRYGVAGVYALDALAALATLADDPRAYHARGELWKAYYHLKGAMNDVAALAHEIAVPQLHLFLTEVKERAEAALNLGRGIHPYTNFTDHYGDFRPEFMVDGDPTTFFWTDRGARLGDYIGVDLGKPELITGVTIRFNQQTGAWARPNDYPKSAMLQLSADGHTWQNVGLIGSSVVSWDFEPLRARYVRALILGDQTEWLQVTDITVRTQDDAAFEVVSPLPTQHLLAVDSLLTSYMVVPRGSVGEVLRITAPGTVQLDAVELFIRPDGPLHGARVEVSADGMEWTVLGPPEGAHGWWSIQTVGQPVRHVRLVVDEPLSMAGYVHEMVLHHTVGNREEGK